ncbi:MAG: nucleotide exchange factor GrpE [Anaerolineae bacterium]|nr:MAG: nucleotide exchange factor GrpE [Anaerolineae bacterium]
MRPESGEELNIVQSQKKDGLSDSEAVDELDIKRVEQEETIEADPETELRNQLKESESQAAEYLEGWQRARAEFANARKRLEKERSEAYQNAASDYAQKLLPVLDDFNRAMDSVPEMIESDKWYEGIELVHKKLVAILENLNVEAIEAVGKPFDPNVHEALSLVESEDVESGAVVEEIQVGYRIGDKVIRPSLVIVAA